MLAAAPINTNLIDETHDVRYLFSRKAAPRFGRPDQFMVIWADGRHREVSAEQWWKIYHKAVEARIFHWTPSRYMPDDPWRSRWAGMILKDNEYGRLMIAITPGSNAGR